jgi:protein-S-isoprenylcysteine O-methyltransferase Ste14
MEKAKPSDSAADNAGVRLPPPLIFLGFLLLGLWYDSPWFEGGMAEIWVTAAGGVVAALGLALIMICGRRFKKVGSNLEPWKPTTTIITTGVYGYSRNPIYLGMALVHGGLAICGGSMAALATVVLSVLVTRTYVIAREERYLEAKFGSVYSDYKNRVRRWI